MRLLRDHVVCPWRAEMVAQCPPECGVYALMTAQVRGAAEAVSGTGTPQDPLVLLEEEEELLPRRVRVKVEG